MKRKDEKIMMSGSMSPKLGIVGIHPVVFATDKGFTGFGK